MKDSHLAFDIDVYEDENDECHIVLKQERQGTISIIKLTKLQANNVIQTLIDIKEGV